MGIRLRVPELLEAADLTAYKLHKRAPGAISLSAAYRLVADRGVALQYRTKMLAALSEVLGVTVCGLFEQTPDAPAKRAKKAPSKRAKSAKRA